MSCEELKNQEHKNVVRKHIENGNRILVQLVQLKGNQFVFGFLFTVIAPIANSCLQGVQPGISTV